MHPPVPINRSIKCDACHVGKEFVLATPGVLQAINVTVAVRFRPKRTPSIQSILPDIRVARKPAVGIIFGRLPDND